MKPEQIIASTCRQKILLALSRVKKTHLTNLVRMINSTYNQVRRNLEILQNEGVIRVQPCGNMKIIQLDLTNIKTKKLLKALQTLETPDLSLNDPKPRKTHDAPKTHLQDST